MSDHMKRLAAPRSWPLKRKVNVFIAKQTAGAHSIEESMPAVTVLRDMIGACDTAKEAKRIIGNREMIVDGKAVKSPKAPVGFMDVIQVPKMGLTFRMLLTDKGKLTLVPINADEARWILCRIENKTKVAGGKIQLNLSGGRNILVDENKYSTGDSVKLCLENNKIVADYPLAENAVVLVISGRHIGAIETVDKYTVVNRPTENTITFKDNTETVKKNVFVIGSGKSELPEVSE